MMEETTSIVLLFYSKYSKACTELIREISSILTFRKICVDHPTIRDIILHENEKYCVRYVPCFFVFYASGIMNKYEGEKAMLWARDIVNRWNVVHQTNQRCSSLLSSPPTAVDTSGNKKDTYFLSLDSIHETEKEETPMCSSAEASSSPPTVSPTMTRTMDTSPLIDPQRRHMEAMAESRQEGHVNERKVMDKKSENHVLNLAQQLQSQREQEEEDLKRHSS